MGNLTRQHFDEPGAAAELRSAPPGNAGQGPQRATVRFFKVKQLLHAQTVKRDQAIRRGESRALIARLSDGVRALELELGDLRRVMLTPRRSPR